MTEVTATRPLSEHERRLSRWMLEHGAPGAAQFIEQLDRAEATLWRCVCGCASFNFKISGEQEAPPGVNILGDYIAGTGDANFGIFIFQSEGILSGVEVYSLGAEVPHVLAETPELRSVNFQAAEAKPSMRDDA